MAYLAARSCEPAAAARLLVDHQSVGAMPTPVTDALQREIGLNACPYGALLVIASGLDGLVTHIVSDRWSVTARGDRIWIDVELTVDAWAHSRIGAPTTGLVDLPFLPAGMIVVSNEQFGTYYRFECSSVDEAARTM